MYDVKQRISQLRRAVVLCSNLVCALNDLGPSRSCCGWNESEEVMARKLEEDIDRKLRTVSYLRNETIPHISRLPEDVLSCIFRVPFRDEWDDLPAFAISVSSVSDSWRRIAHRVPSLWTRLVFRGNRRVGGFGKSTPLREQQMTAYDAWLEKSKSMPLTIDIHSGASSIEIAHFLGTLSAGLVSAFIGKIYLRLPWISDLGVLVQLLSRSQQGRLTAFHVIGAERGNHFLDDKLVHSLQTFFSTSLPVLKDIKLDRLDLPRHYNAFGSCTSLSLMIHSQEVLASAGRLLRSCLQLEQLAIDCRAHWVQEDPFTFQMEIATLPLLKSFQFRCDPVSRSLLLGLRTPRLERLDMRLDVAFAFRVTESRQMLTDFLRASSPPLQALTLRGFSVHMVADAFSLLTDLNALRMCPEGDEQFILELCAQLNLTLGPPLLPHLTHLFLECPYTHEMVYHLIQLLRSRRGVRHVSPICSLELDTQPCGTGSDGVGDTAALASEVDIFILNGKWRN